MSSRKMASFQVTGELIRDALGMPAGTLIYNVVRHDYMPDTFVFYVEHPDLLDLAEGGMPQEIMPTTTSDGKWHWNVGAE